MMLFLCLYYFKVFIFHVKIIIRDDYFSFLHTNHLLFLVIQYEHKLSISCQQTKYEHKYNLKDVLFFLWV